MEGEEGERKEAVPIKVLPPLYSHAPGSQPHLILGVVSFSQLAAARPLPVSVFQTGTGTFSDMVFWALGRRLWK